MRLHTSLLILGVLLAACQSAPAASTLTPETTASATSAPSNTPTATPSPTPTPTPLVLPVSWGSSIPKLAQPITAENIGDVVEVAHFTGKLNSVVRTAQDGQLVLVRDFDGLFVFENGEKHPQDEFHFSPEYYWQTYKMDLQVTSDGVWALVDQTFLVNLQTKEIRDLTSEFNMQDATAALSADSNQLAFSTQRRFFVLDLDTNEISYEWLGGYTAIHGYAPELSRNGKYIAAQIDNFLRVWDLTTEELVLTIRPVFRPMTYQASGNSWGFSNSEEKFAFMEVELNIWDLATGEVEHTLHPECTGGDGGGPRNKPVFSPDDRYLATRERAVSMWHCPTEGWFLFSRSSLDNRKVEAAGRELFFHLDGSPEFITNPRSYATWDQELFFRGYSNQNLFLQIGRMDSKECVFSELQRMVCYGTRLAISYRYADQLSGMFAANGKYHAYQLTGSKFVIYNGNSDRFPVIYSTDYQDTSSTVLYPVALDTDHKILYYELIVAGDSRLVESYVINYETGTLLAKYIRGYGSWGLGLFDNAFLPPDARLHTYCVAENGNSASNGNFYIHNPDRWQLVMDKLTIYCPGVQPAFAPDGSIVVTPARSETGFAGPKNVWIVRLGEYAEVERIPYDCEISGVGISADKSVIAVACEEGTIRFHATDGFEEIGRVEVGQTIRGMSISTDGMNLVAVTRSSISIWGIPE